MLVGERVFAFDHVRPFGFELWRPCFVMGPNLELSLFVSIWQARLLRATWPRNGFERTLRKPILLIWQVANMHQVAHEPYLGSTG